MKKSLKLNKYLILMTESSKKQLGQFMTTNYKYILKGFTIPEHITEIVEPFCGNGDLLKFLEEQEPSIRYIISHYDIEPKLKDTIKRDTLNDPLDYTNKFVITNPPYLARNKSKDKGIYDKYSTNDLYKCFIKQLTENPAVGGILIIPLNFWCSIRQSDVLLRKSFLLTFKINLMNVFEEQVFDDTSYTICSFQFELKSKCNGDDNSIKINIYPDDKVINVNLNEDNDYTIGGELYKLNEKTQSKYIVSRATSTNKSQLNTKIFIKCIDDNKSSRISASISETPYIDSTPNLSARSFASLIITPELSIEQQVKLTNHFNDFLNKKRDEYHSLFLTNYRENGRKRISFSLIYDIVKYLILNETSL